LSGTSSRLTSDADTIPAAFHNLNNAANFCMLIANSEDAPEELRALAREYSSALTRTHGTVVALRDTLEEAYEQWRFGDEAEDQVWRAKARALLGKEY
jgi:hypothetical protein